MNSTADADGTAERHALAVILVAVIVGRLGGDPMNRHLPFIESFEHWGSADQWKASLNGLWWIGAALVCSPWFRIGAVVAGSVELMRVLGNMPQFSNGRTLDGLLLLMIGLSSATTGNRLLRWQYLAVYVGAALNKLLDVDWWTGAFMRALLIESSAGRLLLSFALMPTLAGWVVMAVEATIPVLLLTSRWRKEGVWLCLAFHTLMLLVLREDFGTFYYTVAFGAVLLFYPVPAVEHLQVPQLAPNWLQSLSVLSSLQNAARSAGPWRIRWGALTLDGRWAALLVVSCSIPVQAALVLFLTSVSRLGYFALREALILVILTVGLSLALRARPDRRRVPS